ncbi:PAS domain-containing protein [Pandoraea sp. 64-18]|uniref:PAS domain-containing sensor histidine kinase n=1 Tax=Pandoraea sp. 64-18 TaxID=1895806 RepID=UPI000969E8EA|nr:PAS domain-containing protein [Pandoraea sp. 64-18]OJY20866.1 MAG: histidine kinase [Pandoraea sp. 64-18]
METHGELHRAILNNIPDQAWLKDTESRYILVNDAFLVACGRTEAEIIGNTPDKVWSSEWGKVYLATDKAVVASGERRRYEESRPGADGAPRWFDTVKMPVRDAAGRIVGTVGISRDITDRKRSETALLDSRAQLRQLSAYLQTVREAERTRLSRELHDELGQWLGGLRLGLSYLDTQPVASPADRSAHIQMLKDLVDETIDAVHRIAADLRPAVLDELGLHAALEWLTESFAQRHGLPCELDMPEAVTTRLDSECSTAIFRIVQESLTNASRHGQPSQVRVTLELRDGDCYVSIADDGRGMDTARAGDGQRLGLMGMRERALMLGGAFEIESAPGQGTRVRVRIPARAPAAGLTDDDAANAMNATSPATPSNLTDLTDLTNLMNLTNEREW